MNNGYQKGDTIYRPIPFLFGTFIITWCCAVLMAKIDYDTHPLIFTFLDFMENASPLFCVLLLFRRYLTKGKFLWKFIFGKSENPGSYIIVFLLFAAQFLNFYLFQTENSEFSIHTFMSTLAGQFLLGGGLEEAGWRGYLLPYFHKKHNILLSSVLVSVIWVFWHLPYFFLPGGMLTEDFVSYLLIGIITGFILTAIYLLTKSVLLCTLFHSWQNAIVMTVQADMGDARFMLAFVLLGVVSVLCCLNRQGKQGHL